MKIYHNPRCTKSRETLALLEAEGHQPEIIRYLETPPTQKELKDILKKLGLQASQIVRKGEKLYKEEFKGQDLSEAQWVKTLVQHPRLIERPIVVHNGKAAIGRPPEAVLDIL